MVIVKTCKGCGNSFPIAAFYVHRRMKDGHLNFCKECVKARVRAHARSEHGQEIRRRRGYTWDREKLKQYRPREAGRAHARVAAALRRGQIVRPSTCEECGSSMVAIEAAHADYSRPLDIRWLCRPCHRRWDQRESKVALLPKIDAF